METKSGSSNTVLYGLISLLLILVVAAGAYLALADNDQQTTSQAKDTNTSGSSSDTASDPTPTVYSASELAKFDGKGINKCYVAIDGKVYEVAPSRNWLNGEHIPSNGAASCGRDLTQVIAQAPHGKSVLGELKQVGSLK